MAALLPFSPRQRAAAAVLFALGLGCAFAGTEIRARTDTETIREASQEKRRTDTTRQTTRSEPPPIEETVVVGSKTFTESVILGEIVTQLLRAEGIPARHRRELGGTRFVWTALRSGEVDLYPEYTGTIRQEILAGEELGRREETQEDRDALRAMLDRRGIHVSDPLGFNNTYAMVVADTLGKRLGLQTISDLRAHPSLRFGFSNEFMDRADGWPGLQSAYRLPQTRVQGLDHDLAYRGLADGRIDLTDAYSTDAALETYDLRVLRDDRGFFPAYEAVLLYREGLTERAPALTRVLDRLEGAFSEDTMIRLNSRARRENAAAERIAATFIEDRWGLESEVEPPGAADRIARRTREHLLLVAVSLAGAILLGVPLGIWAARRRVAGRVILGTVGAIYTIPSLALLVFMIPLLGIGGPPAIVALFLYSLLPIVHNTHSGLSDISEDIRDSARALGLSAWARLRLVELPMASRSVLTGIKTSAIINIGTATLGALIGAGGYGQPILTGIRLNDVSLILEGAVPAALLALLAQGLFEGAARILIPRGLRLSQENEP